MLHRITDSQRKRMHAVRNKISIDDQLLKNRIDGFMAQNPLYGALVSQETMLIIEQLIAYDTADHYTDLRYFEALLTRAEYVASLFSRHLYN